MDGSIQVWNWSGIGQALSPCPSELELSHSKRQPSDRKGRPPANSGLRDPPWEGSQSGSASLLSLLPSQFTLMVMVFAALGWCFPSLAPFSPSGKLREVETTILKGPFWQQCPVKPASFPQPHALNSLEAVICPVFSPFSMFGHSCFFKTVLLSLLQVVAGRSQPVQKAWQMLSLTLA